DETMSLQATAQDLEEGDLGAAVTWSATPGGALGQGATLSAAPLAAGSHTITATVLDASGRSASASVTIVVAPLITFTGTYSTTYNNDFVVAKTRFNALLATFLAGPSNLYPVDVEGGTGVIFTGGNVVGQYDRSWTWTQ